MREVLSGLLILVTATGGGALAGLLSVLLYGVLNGTVGWLFQYPVASWFGFTPFPWWVWVCGVIVVRVVASPSTAPKAVGLAQPDRVRPMSAPGLGRW